MKTKIQKRTEAKKQAEAVKAQKKAARDTKKGGVATLAGKKGKSIIPQAKKK